MAREMRRTVSQRARFPVDGVFARGMLGRPRHAELDLDKDLGPREGVGARPGERVVHGDGDGDGFPVRDHVGGSRIALSTH